jgi:hypothetical protein
MKLFFILLLIFSVTGTIYYQAPPGNLTVEWLLASHTNLSIGTLPDVYANISMLQSNVSGLWANASYQEARMNSLERIPFWINEAGSISSNISINSGNVNVTGNFSVSLSVNVSCVGLPTDCDRMEDEESCTGHLNCVWDDMLEECSGVPLSCNSFPIADCLNQEGCYFVSDKDGLFVSKKNFTFYGDSVVFGSGTGNGLYIFAGGAGSTVNGNYAAVLSGFYNSVINDSSVVSGGYNNIAKGYVSTVSGGYLNTAAGSYSVVSGGNNNYVSGSNSVISGGINNIGLSLSNVISGGIGNTVTSTYSVVSGGYYNRVFGQSAVVSGGYTNSASGNFAKVGGGRVNIASGFSSTVSGGESNLASGQYAIVSGGGSNTASGINSFVGGGGYNDDVGSGAGNKATGSWSVIGGGSRNTASGTLSSIIGGYFNVASGEDSVISGGNQNLVNGLDSFILGGFKSNVTGNRSMAAGKNLQAGSNIIGNTSGIFVFGRDFTSVQSDSFNVGFGSIMLKVNATGVYVNNTSFISMEGGNGIFVNVTQTVVRGTIMKVNSSAYNIFSPVAADDDMPVCTMWPISTSANDLGWCMTNGRGYLLVSSTNNYGDVCYVSATISGKADCAASLPSVANHNREVGHAYKVNDTSGLTEAILHFN